MKTIILLYINKSTFVIQNKQHKDNNNQNVNMHVIVTLIDNPLSFNSNNMSSTLYKMSYFHRQLFQNI